MSRLGNGGPGTLLLHLEAEALELGDALSQAWRCFLSAAPFGDPLGDFATALVESTHEVPPSRR
ncbi:MAG: hypothetical protein QM756_19575 [Polyangiaceae bacterium]